MQVCIGKGGQQSFFTQRYSGQMSIFGRQAITGKPDQAVVLCQIMKAGIIPVTAYNISFVNFHKPRFGSPFINSYFVAFSVWAVRASTIRGHAPPWGRSCPIPSISISWAHGMAAAVSFPPSTDTRGSAVP